MTQPPPLRLATCNVGALSTRSPTFWHSCTGMTCKCSRSRKRGFPRFRLLPSFVSAACAGWRSSPRSPRRTPSASVLEAAPSSRASLPLG
eukprot:11450221-Alexandrium_andersonii.AAC.1